MALSVPWADGNWHRHAGQQDTSEREQEWSIVCLTYNWLLLVPGIRRHLVRHRRCRREPGSADSAVEGTDELSKPLVPQM